MTCKHEKSNGDCRLEPKDTMCLFPRAKQPYCSDFKEKAVRSS